jgi:hypothetical protein
MRAGVPILAAGLVAFATALAQYLVVIGKFNYNGWPLLKNPSRGLRISYIALLCAAGIFACVVAVTT